MYIKKPPITTPRTPPRGETGKVIAMRWMTMLTIMVVLLAATVPVALAQREDRRTTGDYPRPTLYATNDSQSENQSQGENLSGWKNWSQLIANQVQERNRQRLELQQQFQERLKEFQQQSQERMKAAKEQLQQLKDRYDEARDTFKNQNKEMQDDRNHFLFCRNETTNGTNATACGRITEKVRNEAKPFLLNSVDLILDALNRIKAHIAASEGLTPEQKADLTAKIDAAIQAVQQAQLSAQNLTNQSTSNDVRDAAREIRWSWNGTKPVLTDAAAAVVNAKLGTIIQSVEQLSTKIHAVRDKLVSQGKNVTTLNEKITAFDGNLTLATQEWQAAVAALNSTADDRAQQAHDHVEKAKGYLTAVRDLLREIVNYIRQLNGSITSLLPGNVTNATMNTTTNVSVNVTENVTTNATTNETGNTTNTTA
jgi:predicted nuclease with TOPRIM domain